MLFTIYTILEEHIWKPQGDSIVKYIGLLGTSEEEGWFEFLGAMRLELWGEMNKIVSVEVRPSANTKKPKGARENKGNKK